MMGNEDIEWQDWLMAEYTKSVSDDLNIDIGDITISGPDTGWIDYDDWLRRDQNTHDNITLTGGGEEMLRVEKDGFYVRGVRVEADAKEAEQVYNAFKQWLTWATLSKQEEE